MVSTGSARFVQLDEQAFVFRFVKFQQQAVKVGRDAGKARSASMQAHGKFAGPNLLPQMFRPNHSQQRCGNRLGLEQQHFEQFTIPKMERLQRLCRQRQPYRSTPPSAERRSLESAAFCEVTRNPIRLLLAAEFAGHAGVAIGSSTLEHGEASRANI